jgi:hypothetical protein
MLMNFSQEGAFDEALKGVDAIEHIASPAHFKADDPEGRVIAFVLVCKWPLTVFYDYRNDPPRGGWYHWNP